MLRGYLLLFFIFIVISKELECTEDGYNKYLELYPFKEADSNSDYYKEHFPIYKKNCRQLNYRKGKDGIADTTPFIDWSDDELEKLGSLEILYSHEVELNEPVTLLKDSMQIDKTERDFLELEEYNNPSKECSTSWATATIEVAEAALKNTVKLSTRQLLECMPKEDLNGCKGVRPKMILKYLLDVGLVEEEKFEGCDSLEGLQHYNFYGELPTVPNASGLMNLIVEEKKPVFVMVALNLVKLRFVKDMSSMDRGMKCGGYEPALYGVVTGYHYDENDIDNSWWELRSHIIPGEEMILRMPMSSNMENANYAGVAAYAFTLSDLNDMTEEPSVEPSTTYICSEDEYSTIDDIPVNATKLIFSSSYSSVQSLDLSRFTQLVELVFADNTFVNCNELFINNPYLQSIMIGDNCFQRSDSGSRRLSGSDGVITILNGRSLRVFIVGTGSMGNFNKIVIRGCVNVVDMRIGYLSFSFVISVDYDDESKSFGISIEVSIKTANTPTIAPTTEAPIVVTPTTDAPIIVTPTTAAPIVVNPTTDAPIIVTPTTEAPTAIAPSQSITEPTPEPTTQLPVHPSAVEVTIIRSTMYFADEESFEIYYNGTDSDTVVFTQPSVSDQRTYSWTVDLLPGDYSVMLTDLYGDGWSTGSNVVFVLNNVTIDTLSLPDDLNQTFVLTIPSTLPTPSPVDPSLLEVTITRTAGLSVSEEFFRVFTGEYSSSGMVFYQPSIADNDVYQWTVYLAPGIYTVQMTASNDGWSTGSKVEFAINGVIIGTYSLSNGIYDTRLLTVPSVLPSVTPTDYPVISYTCSEDTYPSIDDIPADATELIFSSSYSSINSLDLSRFTQLRELVFEDNTFVNCNSLNIANPFLRSLKIGDSCFQRSGGSSDGVMSISNGGSLRVFTVGAGSMGNFNGIVLDGCTNDVDVSIGNLSFSSIVSVDYEESETFALSLEAAIKKANPEA